MRYLTCVVDNEDRFHQMVENKLTNEGVCYLVFLLRKTLNCIRELFFYERIYISLTIRSNSQKGVKFPFKTIIRTKSSPMKYNLIRDSNKSLKRNKYTQKMNKLDPFLTIIFFLTFSTV